MNKAIGMLRGELDRDIVKHLRRLDAASAFFRHFDEQTHKMADLLSDLQQALNLGSNGVDSSTVEQVHGELSTSDGGSSQPSECRCSVDCSSEDAPSATGSMTDASCMLVSPPSPRPLFRCGLNRDAREISAKDLRRLHPRRRPPQPVIIDLVQQEEAARFDLFVDDDAEAVDEDQPVLEPDLVAAFPSAFERAVGALYDLARASSFLDDVAVSDTLLLPLFDSFVVDSNAIDDIDLGPHFLDHLDCLRYIQQ